MADYRTVGAHQINKWLWNLLKNFEYKTGEKAFSTYKDSGNSAGLDLIPIVPGHQWAQLNDMTQGKSPFIVYNYIMSSYGTEWWMCREQCAYVIYDSNEERLRAIHAYLVDLLKRVDWTARSINAASTTPSNFDFKYVMLTSASGPDDYAQTTELSLQGCMVVVNYEYTTDLNSSEGNGLRL